MPWQDWLHRAAIIPALRHDKDLGQALAAPAGAVFLLKTDLLSLRRVVARCRAAGKAVFVHYDLVAGLSADRSGVAFLSRYARPDGLITTRSAVTRRLSHRNPASTALTASGARSGGPDASERAVATAAGRIPSFSIR